MDHGRRGPAGGLAAVDERVQGLLRASLRRLNRWRLNYRMIKKPGLRYGGTHPERVDEYSEKN